MLPQDSAQRQHDQQHTVFILSLPVVIAVVSAGSLPSALPLTELPVNATHSLCKNANKPWSPACCARQGKTRGVQQRRVRFIIVLAFVTKTDTGWQLNRSCIYNYKWGSLFKFIIVTGFDPLACILGFKLFCGSFPPIEHYISNWIKNKLNQELDLEFESELNRNERSHDSRKNKRRVQNLTSWFYNCDYLTNLLQQISEIDWTLMSAIFLVLAQRDSSEKDYLPFF